MNRSVSGIRKNIYYRSIYINAHSHGSVRTGQQFRTHIFLDKLSGISAGKRQILSFYVIADGGLFRTARTFRSILPAVPGRYVSSIYSSSPDTDRSFS